MIKPRVRLAPSNSGKDLHLGNVRTALYNYLIARKYNGAFVLRMEDSDRSRCKDEYADSIVENLNWLGLKPDEGYGTNNLPFGKYMQTQKLDRYRQVAEQLISDGRAYYCYCTQEDLDKQRQELVKSNPKAQFKYTGTCRHHTKHLNKEYVIRFKSTIEGETIVIDKVFGKLTVPHIENQDFVIMRSNGIPLYNFGCVVDDIDQQISLVIRGRDHLINLVPQALLYRALGAEFPSIAHLPMMLSQEGKKFSKRDGGATITEWREKGYSPTAILNYLAKFGWGSGDEEIFSMDDLIEKFELKNVKRVDGKFDPTKFQAINFAHLKTEQLTSSDDYARQVLPFLESIGIRNLTIDQVRRAVHTIRPRAKTFKDAADQLAFFFSDTVVLDDQIKGIIDQKARDKLAGISILLSSLQDWSIISLKNTITYYLTQQHLTMKDVGQLIRIAVSGKAQSPELFQVLNVLGKDKTLQRLERAIRL